MVKIMHEVTVIFDLDGTLVDTAPDLFNTLDHLLSSANLLPVDRAAVRPMISLGARAMISKAYQGQSVELDDHDLDGLVVEFIDYYQQNIAVDSKPFSGVLTQLEHLQKSGATLAVCTNKRESLTQVLLDELDMTRYFSALVGADTLSVCKPHPGHILGTIELVSGDPAKAVMVGDSDTDIKAAKAAEIPVIAVDFGYSTKPVAEYQPEAVISHFDQLPETVLRLLEEG